MAKVAIERAGLLVTESGGIAVEVEAMTAECPHGRRAMVGTFACAHCEFFEGKDSAHVECSAHERRGKVFFRGDRVKSRAPDFIGISGRVIAQVDAGLVLVRLDCGVTARIPVGMLSEEERL